MTKKKAALKFDLWATRDGDGNGGLCVGEPVWSGHPEYPRAGLWQLPSGGYDDAHWLYVPAKVMARFLPDLKPGERCKVVLVRDDTP